MQLAVQRRSLRISGVERRDLSLTGDPGPMTPSIRLGIKVAESRMSGNPVVPQNDGTRLPLGADLKVGPLGDMVATGIWRTDDQPSSRSRACFEAH